MRWDMVCIAAPHSHPRSVPPVKQDSRQDLMSASGRALAVAAYWADKVESHYKTCHRHERRRRRRRIINPKNSILP
ncbi:hypothetical protein B5X24_HaOG214988 [Helicoverpa armigera]|nr:hypothetical protein B5X24_HaOG214988 [Helicoverpa armigera]